MEEPAKQMLFEVARCLTYGETTRLQDYFDFPYPVYYGDDVQVAIDPISAAAATDAYLADLARNGVVRVSVGDVEIVSHASGCCCLRVTWKYEDAQDTVVAATLNDVYFRQSTGGNLKICQLDIHVSTNKAMRKYYKVAESMFDA